MEHRSFRVLVIGGGVTGLVMSHALSAAKIDHLVFESHQQIVRATGGSFGIWANAARILDQLGCWDAIDDYCMPLQFAQNLDPDGRTLTKSDIFERITTRHGYNSLALERQAYLNVLFEKLPDKSRIMTGKRLQNIHEHEHGVEACFDDGTRIKGDIVVGCDGVHSTVRKIMWDHANERFPGTITAREKRSLKSDFKCLVGVAPRLAGIGPNQSITVSHEGTAIQVISQPSIVFFFVCIRRDKTLYWPNRPRYTLEDMEAEAAKLVDCPVNEQVLFGELWMTRTRGYLTSLEEGVYEHWFSNRIVLVGDSVHKMSPVLAHGGNCGLESAATLVNLLHHQLHATKENSLSLTELDRIFTEYQRLRIARVRHVYGLVHMMTRLQTRDGRVKRFIMKYVLPRIKDDAAAASAFIRTAVRLEFLPIPQRPKGSIGFDDEGPAENLRYDRNLNSHSKTKRFAIIWIPIIFTFLLLGACLLVDFQIRDGIPFRAPVNNCQDLIVKNEPSPSLALIQGIAISNSVDRNQMCLKELSFKH